MQDHELVQQALDIVKSNSDHPAEELKKLGKCLTQLGDALDGQPRAVAIAILKSVETLLPITTEKKEQEAVDTPVDTA